MKGKNTMSYEIVKKFEETIAEYAGSKYAVAVDSCTNALFLCCEYLNVEEVFLPERTYPGVACSIINAGGDVRFWKGLDWKGYYALYPYGIIDSALRFRKKMYTGGYWCLSFHIKKHLPIGRGGMILTDDIDSYHWFRQARFDGRHELPLAEDLIDMVGWNMYMTPEQAARGLMLFDMIKDKELPDLPVEEQNYPDLSKMGVYQ